jgi:hypothetical protein
MENIISVDKKEFLSSDSFCLEVFPSTLMYWQRLDISDYITTFYKPKNPESNYFVITIPLLSYRFITYRRLEDVYAKVVSPNKIVWEGNVYIKQ